MRLWRYSMIGSFFNQIFPSGLGGDVFRSWYVWKDGVSLGRSVASVLADRVLGLIAVFGFVAVGIPYLVTNAASGTIRNLVLIVAVSLALGIVAFLRLDLIAGILRRAGVFQRRETTQWRVKRFLEGVERTALSIRSMLIAFPDGLETLALSVANQLILGLAIFLLAGASGEPLDLSAALFLFPYVLLLSMIPVSLAGWGVREGAMVVVFALVGMPAASALTVSVLFGACMFIASLPGAVLWLRGHRDMSPKDLTEIEDRFRPEQNPSS
jgi:uncharacterized protein (TIRG00374 family)